MVFTLDALLAPSAIQYIECARKMPYGTRKSAKQTADKQRRMSGIAFKFYRCPHCGCWHIAHKKLKGKRR